MSSKETQDTDALAPVAQLPSVHLTAQARIREFILSQRLPPHAPLPPEGELAKRLGISRNSVREAVKALASLGIVETRRGSGLFVGNFTFDALLDSLPYGLQGDLGELRDLLAVRRLLETHMAERVVDLVDDAQLGVLRRILDRMKEVALSGRAFPAEDRAFHLELNSRVGNRVITKLIDIFWQAHHRAASGSVIDDPNPEHTYMAHEAIYAALVSREAEELRLTLDKHYDGIYERLESSTDWTTEHEGSRRQQ